MEIAVPDLAGSLGGGGRYDNLVGMFLGRDVPACGFSLGLERILVVMAERAMFPADGRRAARVDVMVTLLERRAAADALRWRRAARRRSARRGLSGGRTKLGKQFKYASSRGVPFVAIVGDDERAAARWRSRICRRGEQTAVAASRRRLARRASAH